MVQPQLLLIGISYISLLVLSIFIVLFVLHYRKKQIGFLAQNAIVQFQYKNEITQAQLEIGQLTMRRTVQNIQNKVGQTLALASMQIRSLQNERMSSTLHPEDLISEALQELRSLTQTLNSDYHLELGLYEAIRRELALVEAMNDIKCNFHILEYTGDWEYSAEQEIILFRSIQESLANASQHSQATEINVEIGENQDEYKILISDDGIGMDLNNTKFGMGITNMKQRLALIHGNFIIQSAPNQGTHIVLILTK
jgi:signal transduction histidine kinase